MPVKRKCSVSEWSENVLGTIDNTAVKETRKPIVYLWFLSEVCEISP